METSMTKLIDNPYVTEEEEKSETNTWRIHGLRSVRRPKRNVEPTWVCTRPNWCSHLVESAIMIDSDVDEDRKEVWRRRRRKRLAVFVE